MRQARTNLDTIGPIQTRRKQERSFSEARLTSAELVVAPKTSAQGIMSGTADL